MKKIGTLLSGSTLALLFSAGIAVAQTTLDTASTTTVGTPNTGAGGDVAINLALLAVSAAIAIVAAYLMRQRRHA